MIEINLPIQIRWADLDPNFHVLHSKYYDFGAFCRMVYLTENGISTALLTENNIGPILLKEDCTFRRELKFEDKVSINLKISWYSKNGARWGMQHQIFIITTTVCARPSMSSFVLIFPFLCASLIEITCSRK